MTPVPALILVALPGPALAHGAIPCALLSQVEAEAAAATDGLFDTPPMLDPGALFILSRDAIDLGVEFSAHDWSAGAAAAMVSIDGIARALARGEEPPGPGPAVRIQAAVRLARSEARDVCANPAP